MNFQIGKNGVNEGVIESLKLAFKTHKTVRISVLKSLSPNKEKMNQVANEIIEKLGGSYKPIIVGFTIILRKTKQQ